MKIYKTLAVAAAAVIAGINVWMVNSFQEVHINTIALADITKYYYNGECVPRGDLNTNWKEYTVRVTCSNQIVFVGGPAETYEVDMVKCGFGDGDCWVSDNCIFS